MDGILNASNGICKILMWKKKFFKGWIFSTIYVKFAWRVTRSDGSFRREQACWNYSWKITNSEGSRKENQKYICCYIELTKFKEF